MSTLCVVSRSVKCVVQLTVKSSATVKSSLTVTALLNVAVQAIVWFPVTVSFPVTDRLPLTVAQANVVAPVAFKLFNVVFHSTVWFPVTVTLENVALFPVILPWNVEAQETVNVPVVVAEASNVVIVPLVDVKFVIVAVGVVKLQELKAQVTVALANVAVPVVGSTVNLSAPPFSML